MTEHGKMSDITTEMLMDWLGSDDTLAKAIDTLTEVANGEYAPEDLAQDINNYNE